MKKIINRKTGPLTIKEAQALGRKLDKLPNTTFVEHHAVYGYPTPEMAEQANLRAMCKAYEKNFVFLYVGTHQNHEGYHAYVAVVKGLPLDFEQNYPDYIVIG